jgi:origin recognition complex subunit 2
MANSDDDSSSDDELEAFKLRYMFQDDDNFTRQWKFFQASGWKHININRTYQAPNGRIFNTAKDVQQFLDRSAIPDVFSNLQSTSCEGEQDDEEARERLKLRNDVLERMHSKRKGGDDDKEEEDNGDDGSVHEATGPSTSLRRSTRSKSNNDESATRKEKGSDLYLHKNSARMKRKAPPVQVNVTSTDYSVDQLVLPTFEECERLVESCSLEDVEEIEQNYEKNHFGDWRFLLSTNHSLLFFGAGSKYTLLNSLCDNELDKEGYSLIINGFDSNASVDGVLDLIVQLFLDGKEPDANSVSAISQDDGDFPVVGISNPSFVRAHPMVERAATISRAFAHHASQTLEPLFLVFHNLDGLPNDAVSQEALAALPVNSKVANGTNSIRIVASIDHVDSAATLWNSVHASANFSWIRKEVHTYRPYKEELAMVRRGEESSSNRKSAKLKSRRVEEEQAARVLDVLKTIAPRHAEVVQILARLQLDQSKGANNDDENNKWVDYAVLFGACKAKYVVSKDGQLQPYVRELEDHMLIMTKTEGGSKLVTIPYSTEKLNEILAYDLKNRS